jgi:hypothetical protein
MLRPVESAASAAWLSRALERDPQYTVAGLASRDYPAYVRILHPAFAVDGPVAWRSVADAVGGTLHPSVQWPKLERKIEATIARDLRLRTDRGGFAPNEGDFPIPLMRSLFPVLAAHTESSVCVAAYWVGWQGVRTWPAPRIRIPERRDDWEYALFSGTLTDILEQREMGCDDDLWGWSDGPLEFSPNFLWPLDRAWLLSTNVDFDSTVVGGSDGLIADIRSQGELETVPVSPSVSLLTDADVVN